MIWMRSHRADPEVVPLADRHYNRQKPGSPQFAPPGRCYRKAGFRPCGMTKGGLVALQLLPEDMPEPELLGDVR